MNAEKSLWSQYCQMQRDKKDEWRECSLFIARYRLARAFNGITVSPASNVSDELVRGYSAGMRLFLAYNTLEMAANLKTKTKNKKDEKDAFYKAMAIDGKKDHQNLLNAFRAFLGEGEEGNKKGKNTSDKILKSLNKSANYFANFLNGESDDLAVLARSIRHLFAHGSFTPNGNDLLKADNIALFDELTEILLEKSRAMFDDYLKEILEKQK